MVLNDKILIGSSYEKSGKSSTSNPVRAKVNTNRVAFAPRVQDIRS